MSNIFMEIVGIADSGQTLLSEAIDMSEVADMEIDGLHKENRGEPIGSITETVVTEEISPHWNDNHQQESPSRKRKLHGEADSGEDENIVSSGDPYQPALKVLHGEEHPTRETRHSNDPKTALMAASHSREQSAGDETSVPPSLGALQVEGNSVPDEEIKVSFNDPHGPPLEAVHFEDISVGGINNPLSPLRASHVEEISSGNENNDPLSALTSSPHVEDYHAGDESNPSYTHQPALQGLHFEENPAGNETEVLMVSPLPDLKALHVVENSENDEPKPRANDPQPELEASLQVQETAEEEDPQSASRRRKLILMSAIASVFSSLASCIASIEQLLLLLQGTGTTTTMDTSILCESSLRRLHRDNNNNNNYLLGFMFLLMQYRRRSQKRPRELLGPWYIKPRSMQGFEPFLDFSPQSDPEKFRELFRISPQLFDYICEMVSDEMLSDTPRSLRVLPNRVLTVQRQVAIALRRLATGNQFLGIADSFGVSKSTAVKVTWKFIVAFIKKAKQQYLQWPRGEHMQKVKDGFKSQWGFPNCCGVIDGTHFTVEFPKGEDVTAYYDHQNHVSISMQAIVDHDLCFMDVVVGWPGSVQDYQLLQNTNFFQSVVNAKDRLNGDAHITQDGSSLREYVIGDAGYPLYDWLMVPYPSGLSAAKDEWNSRHAAARECVGNALGRLKGTWRILSRILWKPRKERIGKMVFACCLLHNMIIEQQDELNPQVYAGVNAHPGGYNGVSVPTTDVFEGGPEARDVLFREVMGGGIV